MSGHPEVVQNSLIVPYTRFTCSTMAKAGGGVKEEKKNIFKYCQLEGGQVKIPALVNILRSEFPWSTHPNVSRGIGTRPISFGGRNEQKTELRDFCRQKFN